MCLSLEKGHCLRTTGPEVGELSGWGQGEESSKEKTTVPDSSCQVHIGHCEPAAEAVVRTLASLGPLPR